MAASRVRSAELLFTRDAGRAANVQQRVTRPPSVPGYDFTPSRRRGYDAMPVRETLGELGVAAQASEKGARAPTVPSNTAQRGPPPPRSAARRPGCRYASSG